MAVCKFCDCRKAAWIGVIVDSGGLGASPWEALCDHHKIKRSQEILNNGWKHIFMKLEGSEERYDSFSSASPPVLRMKRMHLAPPDTKEKKWQRNPVVYHRRWDTIDHFYWPKPGEVYVCMDPQERLGPETWEVSIMGDGTPEGDTVTHGLFWTKEKAVAFADKLLEVP